MLSQEGIMSPVRCLVIVVTWILASSGLTFAQTSMTPAPSSPPVAAQTLPAGRSVWTSQDGSTVDMTVDATTGAITGTFVPGFACGTSTDQAARPIVGTTVGNALSWTLSLAGCPSVGTWIGHVQTVGAEQQLTMLLTLALPDTSPGVGSTLAGSMVFVRQGQ
jgi:hypothetical protein